LLLLPALLLLSALSVVAVRWVVAPPGRVSAVQALHFDYLASPPTATALFPPARSQARLLPAGQSFDLSVVLELPESPVNRGLGVFQVTAQLLTADGEAVAVSSRPAQLRYRSVAARAARAATRWPLLALELAWESQTLRVALFEAFPEQRQRPFALLKVALITRPGAEREPPPQLYAAQAQLTLRLSAAQHCLYYWPLTSAVLLFAAALSSLTCAVLAALAMKTAAALLAAGAGAGAGAGPSGGAEPLTAPPGRIGGGGDGGRAGPGPSSVAPSDANSDDSGDAGLLSEGEEAEAEATQEAHSGQEEGSAPAHADAGAGGGCLRRRITAGDAGADP